MSGKLFQCVVMISALGVGQTLWADASAKIASAAVETAESELAYPARLEPLFSHESSYLTRCRFAKGLKSNLPSAEVDALLQFIASAPQEVGLSRGHFNSVGDKVINALERQNTVPSALVDSLIAMFLDKEGDFTWRDYCVQHLGSLYANDAAEGKRDRIRQVWSEALQPDARMAGTVVLALRKNIGQEGVSCEFAAAQAAEVALDENQPDASRLTAMQVAAEQGRRDMLPLAREIISSKHSVPFRMSAMATIGILGNASDLDLLNKYTKSSDMRLRTASRAAVKKIEVRLNSE